MSDKLIFPDIPLPMYPLEETYEDTSITSKFEDGSVQSRSKFTRSRGSWTMKWSYLPSKEYSILLDFIKNKAKFSANEFYWKPQGILADTRDEIRVRITKFEKWSLVVKDYWSGSITLTEV